MSVLLLADAPALPLGEAGKYVAAAFVVFVAVIFIYVAIMSTKLQRMERELGELNAALAARAGSGRESGAQGSPEGGSHGVDSNSDPVSAPTHGQAQR
jgi:hypothetical protein